MKDKAYIHSKFEYMECSECATKTGSYTLCRVCLHNRDAINDMVSKIEEIMAAIVKGKREDDYRGITWTQTFGEGFLKRLKS